ncbi:hypothetical protein ACIOC1_20610 [Streptomyces sp. NPDC088197]|uniref:hypothetical protein n=1 Tax=unclassified Streptomyces TaxID=2593676 RepID=UPI0036EE07F1
MRARTFAAAAAVLLVAGCGSASGVRVGSPDPSDSSTRPVCGDVTVTPGGGAEGREVCLSVGSTLRVATAPGDRPPGERGAALSEISPGVYRGARVGTAELSGFRRACPGATPGVMSCHAIAGWKITVDVR